MATKRDIWERLKWAVENDEIRIPHNSEFTAGWMDNNRWGRNGQYVWGVDFAAPTDDWQGLTIDVTATPVDDVTRLEDGSDV